MRLWHQALIPQLPRAQLLGQHRECAALRGNGWGRPHATVNYVFAHSPYLLHAYHVLIMDEMQRRGYRPDPAWHDKNHRGNTCPPYADLAEAFGLSVSAVGKICRFERRYVITAKWRDCDADG